MSHRFVEHTGEVRVELVASSCEQLFAEAGLALAELLVGPPLPAPGGEVVSLQARGRDRSALLAAWLNELIFQAETSGRVFTRLRVTHVDERAVRAEGAGVVPTTVRTQVKAATLHALRVAQADGEWRASVVLDV